MPPPPAATYLAFHPQDNNIIAIGMEDSTIQIYNVRVDEVSISIETVLGPYNVAISDKLLEHSIHKDRAISL